MAAAATLCAHAAPPREAVMRFTLSRAMPAGLQQYAIVIDTAGQGRFTSGAPDADPAAATLNAQPIHAGAAALQIIFAARKTVLAGKCESRHKVADTGQKTLQLIDGDKQGSCSFNYSDDEKVDAAANEFQAIAHTLELGVELKRLHRFDRLGLDAAIDRLNTELSNGSAAEPGNIRVELMAIAADDAVLERVRRKAATLLEQIHSADAKDAPSASSADSAR